MDLLFFKETLSANTENRRLQYRNHRTKAYLPGRGEGGDIVLPFILTLMASSLLFLGLFLLNKLYEHRTKDHLNDFQNRWQYLEKRFKD